MTMNLLSIHWIVSKILQSTCWRASSPQSPGPDQSPGPGLWIHNEAIDSAIQNVGTLFLISGHANFIGSNSPIQSPQMTIPIIFHGFIPWNPVPRTAHVQSVLLLDFFGRSSSVHWATSRRRWRRGPVGVFVVVVARSCLWAQQGLDPGGRKDSSTLPLIP